jgi:hypothetical protein
MSIQAQLQGPPFEAAIVQRRMRWEWRLSDRSGKIVMKGKEKSRPEARYQSERALFLMLLTSCRRNKVSKAAG